MKREWTDLELAEHWTLLPAGAALFANKAGPTRLGFGVLQSSFGTPAASPSRRRRCCQPPSPPLPYRPAFRQKSSLAMTGRDAP
jgi:hypothetical protein